MLSNNWRDYQFNSQHNTHVLFFNVLIKKRIKCMPKIFLGELDIKSDPLATLDDFFTGGKLTCCKFLFFDQYLICALLAPQAKSYLCVIIRCLSIKNKTIIE